jgi:aerobic carbon-monoxide dehydrogenase small subunit
MNRTIEVTVNGVQHEVTIQPRVTLLEVLRDHLHLTGTKLGCDQEVCGACTVLLDDLPVSSCSVLGVDADGCQVLTIEGLASNGDLHPIQQAFIEKGAFQCAFCTPGMIMAVKALRDQLSNPSEERVRHFLAGNICRCGCHMEILEVVRSLYSA